jgi:teichuronic acid exporter
MRQAVLLALRWTALGRIGAQFLSLLATLVVVRLLAPAEFGLFALAMMPVQMLTALVIVAPTSLAIQRDDRDGSGLAAANGLLLLLAAAGTLLLVAALAALAWAQDQTRLLGIGAVLIVGVFWPSALAAIWQAGFERRLVFRAVALGELAAGLCAAATTLALAQAGAGVWALALGAATGPVLRCLLLAAAGGAVAPRFPRPWLRRADAAYGGHVALGTLATQVFEALETLLLARALGMPALGAWRTCRELVNVPLAKVMPIVNRVGFPAYARLGDAMPALRHYALLSLGAATALFVPVYWGFAAVSPHAVPLLLGPQWDAAIPVAMLLGAAMPMRLLQYCLILPHQGLGHAALVTRATALIGASGLAGLAAGLGFGLVGAAAGMALGSTAGTLFAVDRALRPLGLSWRDIAARCGASVGAGLAMAASVTAARAALPPELGHGAALVRLVPLGAAVHALAFLLLDRGHTLTPLLRLLRGAIRAERRA